MLTEAKPRYDIGFRGKKMIIYYNMTFACNLTLERSNINSTCHPKENFLDKISLGSKINLAFCNFEMPPPSPGFFFL